MHDTAQHLRQPTSLRKPTPLLAGLQVLKMALSPLALPRLLLFIVAPLALVVVVGALLAGPFRVDASLGPGAGVCGTLA
jgi:hypothetical protein